MMAELTRRCTLLALASTAVLASDLTASECQPKLGVYRHQPQYHIIAPLFDRGNGTLLWPGGVNDANAVFERDGVFHVMHQCDGGQPGMPCGGGWEGPNPHKVPGEQNYWHTWGHVVSHDGARWRRVPDALVPNRTNYEHGADCDGTVSFPDSPDTAESGPIMLFGPGCGYKGGTGRNADSVGSRRRLDAAVVGVARPANASDPLLVDWVKDPANPISFAAGSPPCSFAGRVWRQASQRQWSLVCATEGEWARYTTSDATFPHGPWTLADPSFAGGLGGSSGPAFFPLPRPRAGDPTHIVSDGSGSMYSVGTMDAAGTKFTPCGTYNLDYGSFHWTAVGRSQSDGRLFIVAWVGGGNDPQAAAEGCPKVQGITVCGVQMESIVRVLSFESATQRLLTYPTAELAQLHNGTLFDQHTGTTMQNMTRTGSTAMDLVATWPVAALVHNASFTPFRIGLSVLAASNGTGGVDLVVELAPATAAAGLPTSGVAVAQGMLVLNGVLAPQTVFPVLAEDGVFELRALVDRSVVEFFVAKGRAVVTKRVYPPEGQANVRVFASRTATGTVPAPHIEAYDMDCGWI